MPNGQNRHGRGVGGYRKVAVTDGLGVDAKVASGAVGLIGFALDRVRRRRPVDIELVEEPLDYQRAWTVVTPKPVNRAVPAHLSMLQLRKYFVEQEGAVASRRGYARLTITGRTRAIVRVTDLSAKIVKRTAALQGSQVDYSPAGASDVEGIYFNLDDPDAVAMLDPWPEEPVQPYFGSRHVQLSQGESVTFRVQVAAEACCYRWTIEVEAKPAGGRRRRVRSEQTIRTSGASTVAERLLWAWWEQPQKLINDDQSGE